MSSHGILGSVEKARQALATAWQGVRLVSTPLLWINRNSPRCPECGQLRTKQPESCPKYEPPKSKLKPWWLEPPMSLAEAWERKDRRDSLKGTIDAFAGGVSDFDATAALAYLMGFDERTDADDCAAILSDLTWQGDLVTFERDGSQRWRAP
jgi:hypothetical protein